MRKIILAAIILPLSLSLGGCLTFSQLQTAFTIGTASIANPVTKTREAEIELAGDTIIQAMKAYKRACAADVADKVCRVNVAQVQAYTRQIPPLIAQLRSFVDNNDQINATVIYNQLATLYTNAKSAAANVGINLAGTAP